MRMGLELKVLTLNCWAIPWFSANRRERIAAIATELASGSYDIVVLQEVWSEEDYNLIARKSASVLPYSHYFYSGVIGAGICVLSKGPIVDVLFLRWPLNGYAHKIQHGDWFGGKGVGLCKIICNSGLKINVYVAHLHAEYDRKHDSYLSHRICQGFEFSQFVRTTGETSDVNIVAGDFNSEPGDIPYDILRYNSNLVDSYLECDQKDEDSGSTNEHPRNSYTLKSTLASNPEGKRIDYIMYNYNAGTLVKSLSCKTPLDKCPNASFSYSDHEAVVATLHITKSSSAQPLQDNAGARITVLENVKDCLEKAQRKLIKDRLFYIVTVALLLLLLICVEVMAADSPAYLSHTLLAILRIALTLGLAYASIMLGIMIKSEQNAIMSVQLNVNILLTSIAQDGGVSEKNMSCGDY